MLCCWELAGIIKDNSGLLCYTLLCKLTKFCFSKWWHANTQNVTSITVQYHFWNIFSHYLHGTIVLTWSWCRTTYNCEKAAAPFKYPLRVCFFHSIVCLSYYADFTVVISGSRKCSDSLSTIIFDCICVSVSLGPFKLEYKYVFPLATQTWLFTAVCLKRLSFPVSAEILALCFTLLCNLSRPIVCRSGFSQT